MVIEIPILIMQYTVKRGRGGGGERERVRGTLKNRRIDGRTDGRLAAAILHNAMQSAVEWKSCRT